MRDDGPAHESGRFLVAALPGMEVGLMRQHYVYLMTNRRRNLYAGATNDLMRRVYEHKHKLADGFTKKYNMTWLVYYEVTSDAASALAREKEIKGWRRSKKVALIESMNPRWKDLAIGWYDDRHEEALDPSLHSPRGRSPTRSM